MPVAFTYRELLTPLEGTPEARKLAVLSRQVKIERFLLADVMFNGTERFPDLDFYLEENRRDLTVRKRITRSSEGPLIDWVEAKMCTTDCLARSLTGHSHASATEYRDHLAEDAQKQVRGIGALPAQDQGTRLTSVLFAVHHDKATPRQKYYAGFKNRRGHAAEKIEAAAGLHVRTVIAPHINREVVEDFALRLDPDCRLHVFVLRAAAHATISAAPPSNPA